MLRIPGQHFTAFTSHSSPQITPGRCGGKISARNFLYYYIPARIAFDHHFNVIRYLPYCLGEARFEEGIRPALSLARVRICWRLAARVSSYPFLDYAIIYDLRVSRKLRVEDAGFYCRKTAAESYVYNMLSAARRAFIANLLII